MPATPSINIKTKHLSDGRSQEAKEMRAAVDVRHSAAVDVRHSAGVDVRHSSTTPSSGRTKRMSDER